MAKGRLSFDVTLLRSSSVHKNDSKIAF